ncbi:HAD family hydrolase [Streptomyces sp. NPDC001595]|uniref:HAD family hydrolase n=1 Tax=Streptomyces sp. NPDC001532 TaxID=3154520 RepID=UPI003323798F
MTDPAGGQSIRAVLCDVGNVVRFYDTSEVAALERAAGLPEGITKKVAFAPSLGLALLLGRIDMRDWEWEIISGFAGIVPWDTAAALAEAFVRAPFHADDTVVALLRRARERVPLVLVANGSYRLESELAELGLGDLADHLISSAKDRRVKPDLRIFRLAAERVDVDPEHCLYVDNGLPGIEAAALLGMRTVHYRTPADLERALAPLLRPA